MELQIKPEDFIDWYFNSGSDQEKEQMVRALGERMLTQLMDGDDAFVYISELFDEAIKADIPLYRFRDYRDADPSITVSDVFKDYHITLD